MATVDTTGFLGTELDYIVIFVYFAFVLGFGLYFGRYTASTKDFFFGGGCSVTVTNLLYLTHIIPLVE